MIVGINASFLRKPATGIGQVTTHFLNKLFEFRKNTSLIDDIEFILYLEEEVEIQLPKNFSKNITKSFYKRDDLIRKIWWEKYILPKQILKDKCDVFFSMYQCPTILNSKIKHLMLVHDIIPKIFPSYLGNMRKKTYQKLIDKAIIKADNIITVSKNTKNDLEKYFDIDSDKIKVSYISVDPIFEKEISEKFNREILKKYNISKNYFYIGGGLEIRKNVENSLRAYAQLLDEKDLNKKVPELLVSGKFFENLVPMITDVPAIIKELGIEKQVKFIGFVNQKELPILYKNAKCFIFPSNYEGFGMPVLEAMKKGTPVLTSKKSSLAEVGGDAVIYSDGSVEDIAKKLKKILIDENFANKLGKKGKERSKKFSWNNFSKDVIAIIKKS